MTVVLHEFETEHEDAQGGRWKGPTFWCADEQEALRAIAGYTPLALELTGRVTGRMLRDGERVSITGILSVQAAGGTEVH